MDDEWSTPSSTVLQEKLSLNTSNPLFSENTSEEDDQLLSQQSNYTTLQDNHQLPPIDPRTSAKYNIISRLFFL